MPTTKPKEPTQKELNRNHKHRGLFEGVKEALHRLPESFESPLEIKGVLSTDLFSFNTSLSATIEEQVVASLNDLRHVWDEESKYDLYSFERQPQTFPDVVLRTNAPKKEPKIIMGIELKGWYVLSKEKEPSSRYKVTPSVCADTDLLVIVPWVLDEVTSGSPIVFDPFIVRARYAAEYRNWWWEHKRESTSNKNIILSSCTNSYPSKKDQILDKPASDSGNNFGRFARTGIMGQYFESLFNTLLSGIPLGSWQAFFSLFSQDVDLCSIEEAINKMKVETVKSSPPDTLLSQTAKILSDLADKISSNKSA